MSSSGARRARLRLVQTDPVEAVDWTWFCGRCASRPSPGAVPAPSARVCRSCGLGVLLETRSDVVPAKGDAFVIADSALRVQAMSAPAERLLAMDEGLAVNRAIGDLLVQADVELARTSSFADLVVAALSGEPPISANVRPWNTFGVRLHARIARCGPPPAALIVVD